MKRMELAFMSVLKEQVGERLPRFAGWTTRSD